MVLSKGLCISIFAKRNQKLWKQLQNNTWLLRFKLYFLENKKKNGIEYGNSEMKYKQFLQCDESLCAAENKDWGEKMFPALSFEIRVRMPSELSENCWLNQTTFHIESGIWEIRHRFFFCWPKKCLSQRKLNHYAYFYMSASISCTVNFAKFCFLFFA